MVDKLVDSEANARRVANVENCFGGEVLAAPNRVLVGEGVLQKQCRKQLKPRQFFLFNDVIVYGTIIIHRKKYNNMHLLPLDEVRIVALDDIGPERQNGWQIISPRKSFNVYAANSSEKSEWIQHLNTCIEGCQRKSAKKITTELAPAWIPDDAATHCMICAKVKFSPIARKHHCRRCGKIVCNNCSTKRLLLASQSSEPVRVCDPCFAEASAKRISVGDVKPDSSGDEEDSGDDSNANRQEQEPAQFFS
ncbi:pleckstrin homology domain-containing family F member 2-like [Bolinopsis microptera]|uniref:pleckstrin homology domain-containing family F member 2-like n=1 Tax=Bolinopsis microptera TaxID=2820187 RepID=UPI0030796429